MFEDKRLIYGIFDTELGCYLGIFPADDERLLCAFLSTFVEEDFDIGTFGHCDVHLLGDVSLDTGRLESREPAPECLASVGALLKRYDKVNDDCGNGFDDFRSDGVDAVSSDG